MKLELKVMGEIITYDLKTPEESWACLTGIGKTVKEHLGRFAIGEYTLGKVFLRLDMKTQHYNGATENDKIAVCSIEAFNITYKTSEESKPSTKRFRVGEVQTLESVMGAFKVADQFAKDIDRSFKLLVE